MKKIFFIFAIMVLSATTFAAPQLDQQEYEQLIQQCHSIKTRIQSQHDFEPIKQWATKKFYTETVPGIMHAYSSWGGQRSGSYQAFLNSKQTMLDKHISELYAEHRSKMNDLIADTITAFLKVKSTPESQHLLSEFIVSGFSF